MTIPIPMPITKPARAPKAAKRFSLVPADAQYEMVRALSMLKSFKTRLASGSEVAEVAVCLAAGTQSPVVLACKARGARCVRHGAKLVEVSFRSQRPEAGRSHPRRHGRAAQRSPA